MDTDIDGLRDEIRGKDLRIIELIAERIECAERIAEIKIREGLPIKNPEAEEKVVNRYLEHGRAKGIGEDTMLTVALSLIDECVRAENRIADKTKI